jgi:hypothetical protein
MINVRATLTANIAALVGKQMYKDLSDRWQAAVERHATPDGRLPFGAIASFLVDDVPALLSDAHVTYLIQHELFACAGKEVVVVEDDDEVTQRL